MKWIQNLRLAFSCNNIFTLTSYKGLTPMINSASLSDNIGLDDKQIYPLCRTFTLSMSVTF